MKQKLSREFDTRQTMSRDQDYEIFYYQDLNLKRVSPHAHGHYEFYFFLEGNLDYRILDQSYTLKPGDCMLIPPGTVHQPLFQHPDAPYRRIILWLSENFYDRLCHLDNDFGYGYSYVRAQGNYHFKPEQTKAFEIQSKLIELIEEGRSSLPFDALLSRIKIAEFFVSVNRFIYTQVNPLARVRDTALHIRICDYIHQHLTEDLTLDGLAGAFYLNKYHIAHIFKENMGLSVHQYVTRQRLETIKNGILAGMPVTHLAEEYGFREYSSFYRAFKKEYQVSPAEYRELHMLD